MQALQNNQRGKGAMDAKLQAFQQRMAELSRMKTMLAEQEAAKVNPLPLAGAFGKPMRLGRSLGRGIGGITPYQQQTLDIRREQAAKPTRFQEEIGALRDMYGGEIPRNVLLKKLGAYIAPQRPPAVWPILLQFYGSQYGLDFSRWPRKAQQEAIDTLTGASLVERLLRLQVPQTQQMSSPQVPTAQPTRQPQPVLSPDLQRKIIGQPTPGG